MDTKAILVGVGIFLVAFAVTLVVLKNQVIYPKNSGDRQLGILLSANEKRFSLMNWRHFTLETTLTQDKR